MSFIDDAIDKFDKFEKDINIFCKNRYENNEIVDLEIESIKASLIESESLLTTLKSLVIGIDKSIEIINKEKILVNPEDAISRDNINDYLEEHAKGHEKEWKIICSCSEGATGVRGKYKLYNKIYSYFFLSDIRNMDKFDSKVYVYAFPEHCLIWDTLVAVEDHLGNVHLVKK